MLGDLVAAVCFLLVGCLLRTADLKLGAIVCWIAAALLSSHFLAYIFLRATLWVFE